MEEYKFLESFNKHWEKVTMESDHAAKAKVDTTGVKDVKPEDKNFEPTAEQLKRKLEAEAHRAEQVRLYEQFMAEEERGICLSCGS